ncbi:hypothetical protein LXL04_021790 [Taraxacum kok-saghyz]
MVDDLAWISGLSSLVHLDLCKVDLGETRNKDTMFYMIPSLQVLSLSGCRLSNADIGSFLNSSGILPNIKRLDLGFNSFERPLPDVFQNLSSLTSLDLSHFDLSLAWNFANLLSMIPLLSKLHLSECGLDKTHLSSSRLNFSTLSNIQCLGLNRNSIGGTFPSVLTNMSSLRFLDLSYNMLNSSVPSMPNLLDLDLFDNQFKQIGDVGIWRQCHLERLDVSYNYFEKYVTDSPNYVSECSHYALEWLDLSECLNCTIPIPLRRLHNLRVLRLMECSLTGLIPESLEGLRSLEVLNLSGNQLIGRVPTFHGNLSKLNISYNHWNSSIPKSLGNLGPLTYLDLTDPIPPSVGRFVSLQVVSVAGNLLNGTIPVTIGKLAKLHSLDLSSNTLEGVVSESHFLNKLDVSFNTKLTFNISRKWMPPFRLVSLRLASCNIANGFLQWLRNQRNFKRLVLSNANILGPLPKWLRKMPIMPYLDLSHNKLSGPLTNRPNGATYGYYMYGTILFIQYNSFNESIPMSLCRTTNLKHFDFSNNRLTGLGSIILSSNKLSGVIPPFITLNSLFRLKLNGNNFVGILPRDLGNLPYIRILDVGENKLLHKNNFSERIPHSLCKVSNLHILDVAHNNLKGSIPRCLGE